MKYENVVLNNQFIQTNFDNEKNYELNLTSSIRFGPLGSESLSEIFKDGRISGIIMKKLLAATFKNLKYVHREKSASLLINADSNESYDTRVLTKNGVQTCPSYMLGASRGYNEANHAVKLNNADYFIFVDVTKSPIFKVFPVVSNHKLLFKKTNYKSFYSKILQQI